MNERYARTLELGPLSIRPVLMRMWSGMGSFGKVDVDAKFEG